MKNIIQIIQDEDPSYNPLYAALKKSHYSIDKWNAATDRIYMDGYYGPISAEEWKEQDGREPYSVSEALTIVAKVLDKVENYVETWDSFYVEAEDIRAALVSPWYSEIYGTRYPSVR